VHRPLTALTLLLAVACGSGTAMPSTSSSTTTTTSAATTTTGTSEATLPSGVIGHSRQGREIVAETIGSGAGRIYVLGGIHGDERPAVENSRALLDHLRESPPAGWTIRFVIDANPDGTAAGTRDNAAGVDLNRNWPSTAFTPGTGTGPSPLSEPEAASLAADIASFAPELIVAMHAAREGPFTEFDGAGGEDAAHRFAAGASSVGREWMVVPDVDWSTVGSIGTYFGDEGRIPVVTVEANRWDTPSGVTSELIAGFDALLSSAPSRLGRATVCDEHRIGVTCAGTTGAARALLRDGTTGGAYGFIVKEVGGPVLAALDADRRFYPASALKLVHFAHALAWIAEGGDPTTPVTVHADGCAGTGPGPDVSLDELLERMMRLSDNAAANAIQAYFGEEALALTIATAGMTGTRLVHGFGCGGPANDPANTATAVDLISLLEGIVDGSLVPPSAWPMVEATMVDTTSAAGLDESGIRVLAKEGWYGTTLTIAGIAVFPTGPPVVFAAYTDGAQAIGPAFAIAGVAGALVGGSP